MKKMILKIEDLEERIAPTVTVGPVGDLFSGLNLPTGDAVNETAVAHSGPWSAGHANGASVVSHS